MKMVKHQSILMTKTSLEEEKPYKFTPHKVALSF